MPTRIRLFGDTQAADQYRFIAYRKVLGDALKLRSFRNLPIFRHQARIEGGGMIDVVCHHSMNEIAIYVPPREMPEQEVPEQPGGGILLILLGDESVGYHFMLWDAYGNAQMSPIKTADSLEEVYRQFPPAEGQDDCYIAGTQAGVAHYDFHRYDYSTFSEALFGQLDDTGDYSDSFTREYEHPVEGTVVCTAEIDQVDHQNNSEVEFDGPQRFSGLRELLESLDQTFTHEYDYTTRYVYRTIDRNIGTFAGKLPPMILVKNIPVFEGDHYAAADDKITETTHRDHRFEDSVIFPNWSPTRIRDISEIVHAWTTPIGNLRLKRRLPQNDAEIEKPWHFSYWQDAMTEQPEDPDLESLVVSSIRADTEMAEESRIFYLNIEKKNSYNFPDTSDGNIIGNKTIDARVLRDQNLAFQIYTVSLVEWAGKPDADGSTTLEEMWKADSTWAAAACGRLPESQDPEKQERASKFEEAIAQLIDRAAKDQLEAGKINNHRHYRGYIHGYFYDLGISDIFSQPRSRDAERLKLLNLVNQARKDNGLEPVKYSWDLEKAAIRFTFDMVDDLHIGHAGQDGSDAQQRQVESGHFINAEVITQEMKDNNSEPMGGWENTGRIEGDKSAETIFDGWMNSDSHRANILDSDLDKNGAMGADYRLGSDGYYYWAQEFGRNPNY